jgi:hypothetical protein
MKVAVVVLSDIHFDANIKQENPVFNRTDQIVSAISMVEVHLDGVVLLLPGDVANSGRRSERFYASRVSRLHDRSHLFKSKLHHHHVSHLLCKREDTYH